MNTSQPCHKTFMKTNQLTPVCAVQSVTDAIGRRTVTFYPVAPRSDLARTPIKRRKSPLRLQLLTAPESAYSFEPTIQVRSQSKP